MSVSGGVATAAESAVVGQLELRRELGADDSVRKATAAAADPRVTCSAGPTDLSAVAR